MIPIITPAEAAALDAASAERGVRTETLMEAAGRAVAAAAVRVAGGRYGRRSVVVCGRGNNGGDGLVAARYLDRWGMGVRVQAVPGTGGPNRDRLVNAGVEVRDLSSSCLVAELDRADVAVDALFGTGFSSAGHGPPSGEIAAAIEALSAGPPTVAVDIPSGVEGATGAVPGPAVAAELTVTFGALKPGVVFHPGAGLAGRVQVAGIGFPPDLVQSDLSMVEPSDAAALLRPRGPETHKYSAGAVLVLAGSRRMVGAAALSGEAAYRAGAGLVTLALPASAVPVVQARFREAVFLPLPETPDGAVSEEAWGTLAGRFERVSAAAVGPGLSTDPSTVRLVRRLVAECPVPFVLDADGLNALEGAGDRLRGRRSPAVVTPHAGEFARLIGRPVGSDRAGAARRAAAELGCPVLLKGARTVVAEPEGRARVNPTGGPNLATGGTGDVLTGVIGALLARGLDPADAAVLGAIVHGAAGDLARDEFGDGTVAGDVAARLPRAIRRLEASAPW